MSLATWKALCMDAVDARRLAGFWSTALGMSATDEDGIFRLTGDDKRSTIWINPVAEAKTVKHRVHLDVEVGPLDRLHELGATDLRPPTAEDDWWIMADAEDGEFCAFLRDGRPSSPARLYQVVVDCADPHGTADWWGDVLGLPRERQPKQHYAALESAGKLPFDFFCFVPVPEPKSAKNRVHWDIFCPDVQELVEFGAQVLREPDDDISWHIMADPEGNEFCAFTA